MNRIVEDEEGFSGEKIGFLEEKTEIWKEKKMNFRIWWWWEKKNGENEV